MTSRNNKEKRIAADPVVQRMCILTAEYCRLLESGTTSQIRLLRQAGDLLPELFSVAMRLPNVRSSDRISRELKLLFDLEHTPWNLKPSEKRRAENSRYRSTLVSTQRFFVILRRLNKVLGDLDPYREVFDPYEHKDAIQACLSNDLAEIWHDVKPPLLLFETGEEAARRHAVYTWALQTRIHWGRSHFCDAMKVIFFALADDDWTYPFLHRSP